MQVERNNTQQASNNVAHNNTQHASNNMQVAQNNCIIVIHYWTELLIVINIFPLLSMKSIVMTHVL